MDTIVIKLLSFKILNPDNFYHKSGKTIPVINTLRNHASYWQIPTDGNYQEYRLKSFIKYQPLGYRPYRIRIKDIPQNYLRFWLEIEISIPKLFFGHNLYEIQPNHLEQVVQAIYEMLLQFGIETDPIEIRTTTNISRIDFCKNVLIQTSIEEFIELLQKFQKKRSTTDSTYKTTVSFGNKQQRLVIYGKVEEILAKTIENKKYNNKSSKEYQLAQVLSAHKQLQNLWVIRIEHRLFNRQSIKRELKPIMGSYPITFENLFNAEINSKILIKHWENTISERKFKLLLLGEKDLHFIFDEIAKIAKGQLSKNINSIFIIYPKLLSEIGEVSTNKKILGIKSATSLIKYQRELNQIADNWFCYDTRLEDYKRITQSLHSFDPFTLPKITNEML